MCRHGSCRRWRHSSAWRRRSPRYRAGAAVLPHGEREERRRLDQILSAAGQMKSSTNASKRQMTEGENYMKAIVVTDQAAGTAGMKLVERPEPQGAALASLSGAN